jgi:hypothetical protein
MRLKNAIAVCLAVLLLPGFLFSESLFEDSNSNTGDASAQAEVKQNIGINISGYVKAGIFAGEDQNGHSILMGNYGELDLKGDVVKEGFGRAFIDIREDAGYNGGMQDFSNSVDAVSESIPDIREAWVEVEKGIFSLTMGKQIIVWGRADSINPTNNLTPINEFALSSEIDDTRMGNEMVQLKANLSPMLSLTGIWIPGYEADNMPLNEIPFSLPPIISGVSFGSLAANNQLQSGSSGAARLDISADSIDGSISYYYGYNTLPGFNFAIIPVSMTSLSVVITPIAYKMQAIGGDFSTALWNFGLRGEACVKIPELSPDNYAYIPKPYAQYVGGIDRTFGDFNALVQYSGVTVMDYKEVNDTEMTQWFNQLFTGTKDRFSHTVTASLGWNGVYDTLHAKLSGMYDFTTREYVLNPDVTYDVADALKLTAGWRDFYGPDNSLNSLISKLLSTYYIEIKNSF